MMKEYTEQYIEENFAEIMNDYMKDEDTFKLINAVNKIDGIKVTERHKHEKEVGYIEMGKDSTVVYDGLDLKFENNTGYDIKLYAELSDKKIKVKVNKLK